jgi:hypothetical protein
MGTKIAQDIIDLARLTLFDASKVRWTDPEMLSYLNDGQREICIKKPAAYVVDEQVSLQAGVDQTIPSDGVQLVDIRRNGAGLSVTFIARRIMDAMIPNWQAMEQVSNVVKYMYDPVDPKVFQVYPPAKTGATAVLATAKTPPDTLVNAAITIDDIYSPALIDYMLFRAYAKESDFAGDAGRAAAHYAKFTKSI